jgi:hypothetical protein
MKVALRPDRDVVYPPVPYGKRVGNARSSVPAVVCHESAGVSNHGRANGGGWYGSKAIDDNDDDDDDEADADDDTAAAADVTGSEDVESECL